MASWDGQINGSEINVFLVGSGPNALIGYGTNATLNINHSPRSTSSKESGGWDESMEGMRSWDVSCDCLYAWLQPDGSALTTTSLSDMFTAYIATRAQFLITFGANTAESGIGKTKYSGQAWLTSANITAATEDTATFTVSFQGSGVLTQTIDTTP